MKKFIHFTKPLIIAVTALAATTFIHAIMISQSYITQRVRDEAQSYVRRQGFSTYDIPKQLTPELDQRIEDAVQNLHALMRRENRSYVDLSELENEVAYTLQKFVDTLRTLIFERELDWKAPDHIKRVAKENGVNVDTLSTSLWSEYYDKKGAVIKKLRDSMKADGRSYVRINEIERETRNVMKDFFKRATQTTTSSSYSSSGSWDSWGSSSYAASSTSTSSNRVYRSELDKKALDIAYEALRDKGINQNDIPARVVSDLSDKVQEIIRRMKNHMSYTNQDYVTTQDIKQAAEAEMTSIVNKIFLRGEICVVCQDEYKSGEKVGVLSCNHLFHKDCIYAWLEHQKTCPLCRQNNVIVAKQERVP